MSKSLQVVKWKNRLQNLQKSSYLIFYADCSIMKKIEKRSLQTYSLEKY